MLRGTRPQSGSSVPKEQKECSAPGPPSSQSPSFRKRQVWRLAAQSGSSVPNAQKEYSEPGPPSSQSPSPVCVQRAMVRE